MTYIAHAIHTTCAQGVHGTSPKNVDMQSLYIYLKVVDLILKNIGLDPNYKGYVLKRREKILINGNWISQLATHLALN